MTDYWETRTSQREEGREGQLVTFKATRLIWLLLGFLEAVLVLRFFFRLIGANPENTLASLLYGLTNVIVAPFASLTEAPSAVGMVFEFSTLIAMIVYAPVAWAVERLVYVAFYRPHGPLSTKQTTVSDHTPAPSATGTRTTTTEDINTRLPIDTPKSAR